MCVAVYVRHGINFLYPPSISKFYTPDPGISPEVDEGVDAGVAHGYQQEHGVDVAEYVTGKKQIQIR